MKSFVFIFSFFHFFLSNTFSQGLPLPIQSESSRILDRLNILYGGNTELHTGLHFYQRKDAVDYAMKLDTAQIKMKGRDRQDIYFLFKDNNEWLHTSDSPTTLVGPDQNVIKKIYVDSSKTFYTISTGQAHASYMDDRFIETRKPLFKYFYKSPANLFEITKKDFFLRVNPMLDISLGKESRTNRNVLRNMRGVEIRGAIDDRVYFYTNVMETQVQFPGYVQDFVDYYQTVPGALGIVKNYNSNVFKVSNGYDFLNASGYLGFNLTRHIGMQLGHGQNFIGNGMRSLLMSDFASNYFYLKFNTRVWKLHYQNIFAELDGFSNIISSNSLIRPKKYMAAHYLSYRPSPKTEIGLFEMVLSTRKSGPELQYFNPIILYRSVEGSIGSPDNVIVGMNARQDLFNRISVYGQLLLDEFIFRELLVDNTGSWTNKFGWQAGIKYMNVAGIDHLDMQLEYNKVRPYTYTHFDSTGGYTHFGASMAHPMGANLMEVIGKVRYQPFKKWILETRFYHIDQGRDFLGTNFGGDINKSYTWREKETGNFTGQGELHSITGVNSTLSYSPWHNLFLDLNFIYRKDTSFRNGEGQTIFSGGIRLNTPLTRLDF
jgi:hypothetical protein